MILEKTVRAKKDTTVITRIEEVHLYVGQVREVKFLSQAEYEGHIAGGFIEAYEGAIPEDQTPPEIPIIAPIPKVVTIHTPEGSKVENTTLVPAKDNVTNVPVVEPVVDAATASVEHNAPAVPVIEVIEHEEPVIPDPKAPVDVVVTKEAQVKSLNAKGPPYKCTTQFCDRIRKKTELHCKVCLDNMGNKT
jgi:hypothetical protein